MRMAVNSRSKQQNRLNCFVDNGVEAHNLDMLMTIDRRGLRGHTLFVASRCRTGGKNSLPNLLRSFWMDVASWLQCWHSWIKSTFSLSLHNVIGKQTLSYLQCRLVVRVSGYRYRGLGFDSRRYQIFWIAVGLERGPLSLVRSIEELLE